MAQQYRQVSTVVLHEGQFPPTLAEILTELTRLRDDIAIPGTATVRTALVSNALELTFQWGDETV